ncbi:MAG TPA: DUF5925 domain-containing protein [Gaiellaceae bacterium]|nr:DUF5925 domain-containing protein [Gaiellaceae bacterium]
MPPLGDRVRIVQNAEMGEVSDSVFIAGVHDRGATRLRRDAWPTAERAIDRLGPALFLETSEGHSSGVWESNGTLLRVTIGGGWLHLRIAGSSDEAVEAAFAGVRALFPLPDPSSSREVPVTFWTYTPHGPMPSPRTIAVPEWEEISTNYAETTRRQLDAVMREFRPSHGGQLVLWHGTPGTGKTFALRALAWEWREWCQLHYIVDPDSFFGQHADYLMNVLMQPGMPMMALGGGVVGPASAFMVAHDGGEDEEAGEQAWRLLVLEDTGELLTPDAKSVIGQGLSRFLNVVDGLIGQGLRVLVLVTTNEEIKSLHPAVARPGRAAANVMFSPLSAAEATEWLRERGIDDGAESRTIASLYAQLDGRDPGDAVSSVGFGDAG